MNQTVVGEDIRNVGRDIRREEIQEKEILVTGGAGFIGSYICETLVSCGSKVTCIDNFSTGLAENLETIIEKRNFKLIQEDVSTFDIKEKYGYIFHLASRASPEEYQLHPVDTLIVNSIGSYKLLELARKCDATILFASTSEAYGDPKVIPTPETYWGNVNPIGPRSCYDEGKRFGEALFMAYHRGYGLDVRIVRIHNTYGPRLRADGYYARALSRFISQALEGEDITVYGNGMQTRSFCYITDTAKGLLQAMTMKEAKGETINIGSPTEITILELARRIREMTGSKSEITFHPSPPEDPKRRCPDISKARHILNWVPKISLEEGLDRTIRWFQTRKQT